LGGLAAATDEKSAGLLAGSAAGEDPNTSISNGGTSGTLPAIIAEGQMSGGGPEESIIAGLAAASISGDGSADLNNGTSENTQRKLFYATLRILCLICTWQ
jgi:hypothetical protein